MFIDGKIRKRGGELVGLDASALVEDATKAMAELKERVGVPLV